jgi:hypothetical protein
MVDVCPELSPSLSGDVNIRQPVAHGQNEAITRPTANLSHEVFMVDVSPEPNPCTSEHAQKAKNSPYGQDEATPELSNLDSRHAAKWASSAPALDLWSGTDSSEWNIRRPEGDNDINFSLVSGPHGGDTLCVFCSTFAARTLL